MSHQWTMEDFESIYSRFKSSGLSVMDFCSNDIISVCCGSKLSKRVQLRTKIVR